MSTPRIKDASFLQQHIEKLILAAGLFVFAIAVFLFVMGNPFAVEVNNQAYPEPSEAIDVLVRTDDQLEAGLQDPDPLPEIITPQFSEDFMAMMNVPIDMVRLARGLGAPGLTIPAVYPDIPEPARYALVYPPAPKNIFHVSGTDVLDKEFAPEFTKEFFELWGKELDEPGDFTMFVASGEFDIWEWITRLKAAPQVEGDIKIPTGIWAQRFGVAGVALLREEWDPEQGRWTNRQIVVPLPGQERVLPDDEAEADTNLAIAKLTELRDKQVELAQPELPWLTDFVQVTPPGDADDGSADGLLQALGEGNLGPAEKEILKLQEKIEELQERQAKRQERESGSTRPDRSRGGDGDFDAPGPRGGEGGDRRDPIARQIESLQDKIARLQPQALKEEENRKRLEQLRLKREEERKRREALRGERDRALGIPDEDPLGIAGVPGMEIKEGSTLRVWAADPSMQPGKTYRYKLLVSVINPLYAVPRLAPDQLEENKNRAALLPTQAEIDAMPWIGPIKVEPKSRFFFTSGGQSRARIEIYRRHNGELIMQEFDANPGDQIGGIVEVENQFGQPMEIDMRVDAILVDVEKRRDLFSNATAHALIYTDEQGDIHERTDLFDKSSPALKDLRQEMKDGPEQPLRPDPDAQPGGEDFAPGGFGPGFEDF